MIFLARSQKGNQKQRAASPRNEDVKHRASKCHIRPHQPWRFDPGDPQGGKRTSTTTHDQHDQDKVKALEGKDGTNLKEIGAKTDKNNENDQTSLTHRYRHR